MATILAEVVIMERNIIGEMPWGRGQRKSLWTSTCEIESRDSFSEDYAEADLWL